MELNKLSDKEQEDTCQNCAKIWEEAAQATDKKPVTALLQLLE